MDVSTFTSTVGSGPTTKKPSTATTATTATTTSSSSTKNNAEMEETLARIRSHKGVQGILVMTKEGAIIQSTLTEEQSSTHAALLSQLTNKTSSIIQTLALSDGTGNGTSSNRVSGSTGATTTATGNESNEGENKSANGNDSTNTNTIVGDELTFLRIRSKNKEIMIAPDGDFLMVVIQNPNSVSM